MVKSEGAFVAETGLKDSFVWMVAGALFFFGGMVGMSSVEIGRAHV